MAKKKAPGKAIRKGVSIIELTKKFHSDQAAEKWFEEKRWGKNKEHLCCPRCGGVKIKGTAEGKPLPYWCGSCRRHFSVRVGTAFERSKISLQKWGIGIYLWTTSPEGVSSMKLHRELGISQKSAYFMAQRLREACQSPLAMQGPVEIDGATAGKRKNMSSSKKKGADRQAPDLPRSGKGLEMKAKKRPIVLGPIKYGPEQIAPVLARTPAVPAGELVRPNRMIVGDAVDILNHRCAEGLIDLTVTSPPYDDLRNYNGYSFNAEAMLSAIYRVTKVGGVCVWVVGEKVEKGRRTLTSFRHALIGEACGFNVHDVMIYQKKNTPFQRSNAYTNCYELMIVFSKGKPKTFNPIKVPTQRSGWETAVSNKGPEAVNKKRPVKLGKEKTRNNIWDYAVGGGSADKIAFDHPAIFPEKLAADHIISWSNEGDVVLDPMCGSGTSCKMAAVNKRYWIGMDISQEYIELAAKRVALIK